MIAFVTLISLQGTGLVGGYFGNANIVNVNVSSIDTQAATPYLEVTGYQFQGVVDSPKNFTWLWLSSSYDFESRSEMALPLRETQGNTSVIVAYVVSWQQTFPPQGEPKMNLVTVDESTFRIGFMLAFTTNVTFSYPQMYLNFESNGLGDQWTHTESYERFDVPPDNATLAKWGLHPPTFKTYEDQFGYQTFYIYEFTLTRAGPFIERMNLIYKGPAYVLLLVLGISIITLIFKGIRLGDAIAFYFGSAFFSLSFLLSYLQLGIGPVLYIENLMELDTYAAVLLAGMSMVFRMFGRRDDESLLKWGNRVTPMIRKVVRKVKRHR